ncbi:MAG: hypothetical protein RID53_10330 [Coleofasciculus sp. B1-GNL1-01]|uniref:hypothetical protein n=1 Tax=Coleofasciculus sp. B1-GNL1-01 TaxID=3068484 RepID=UPI0033020A64
MSGKSKLNNRRLNHPQAMPENRFTASQAISHDGIEVRIYPVEQGYRVVVSSILNEYWHPGIFPSVQELWDWVQPQVEALAEDGLPLAREWMMLDSDFDGNGMYGDWFINQAARHWEGYDPLTNRCYTASTRIALTRKIDQIQAQR